MQVRLNQFEGPLALLLYLIKREEMDIYDIPIHKITQQYLEQLKLMGQLDLEVAGEFVAMAATLIHIKSKMLLPQVSEEGEEEEALDPRTDLVQKLLAYQKYKEASKALYDRPLLGRDIFSRGVRESIPFGDEGEIIVEESGLFSLISSYRKAVRSFKKRVHKIVREGQSIASRVMEIKDRLVRGVRISLRNLISQEEAASKSKVIITFLSILELSKMGFLSLFQSEPYSDIYVDTKEEVDGNVISRVEEYDSAGAESVANKLFADENVGQEFQEMDDDEEIDVTAEAPEVEEEDQMDLLQSASDEEIEAAELEMGLPEIEEDQEFLEEKERAELFAQSTTPKQPDILNEITEKFESNEKDDDIDGLESPVEGGFEPEPTV